MEIRIFSSRYSSIALYPLDGGSAVALPAQRHSKVGIAGSLGDKRTDLGAELDAELDADLLRRVGEGAETIDYRNGSRLHT
jgi:hypothetical protein